MSSHVSKVTVWSAELEDRPGAAASKLSALAEAGTDLQLVLAHRMNHNSGRASIVIAPIRNRAQVQAAEEAGFRITPELICVKVEGANKPGLGSRIAGFLAEAGLNLQGFNGLVSGKKFVAFITFENSPDAEKGMKLLRRAL